MRCALWLMLDTSQPEEKDAGRRAVSKIMRRDWSRNPACAFSGLVARLFACYEFGSSLARYPYR